jgi:mannosyltransferase
MTFVSFIKKYRYLLLILAGGIILRLYNLTAISLWHDEAFSALLVRYPWGEMFHRISLDVHPPAYYVFLRLWHDVVGDSLWSLRGFSALFSIGIIPLAYGFVKSTFQNEKAALLAALLIAVSPFQISFVTEARMYTMGAFFALAAAWALTPALSLQRAYYEGQKQNMPNLPENRKLRKQFLLGYLAFAFCTIIIIYTHYYLLFTASALCFYGLLYHWRAYGGKLKHYSWLALSFALIALAYLPWLKVFLFQLRQVGGNYWIQAMDRWSIPDTVWNMLFGLYADRVPSHLLLAATILLSLAIFYFIIRKIGKRETWLVVLNVIAPFAGAVAFVLLAKAQGHDSSVYLVRYFLFASTFYLIAVGLWLAQFRPPAAGKILATILVVVNLYAYYRVWHGYDVKNHRGMAAAVDYLAKNVESGHKLYLGSSFEFFNFKYYNRTPVQPLLYSGGITNVSQLPHYAGTAILTDDDLLPSFSAATRNGDTVWLLWTNGFGGSKPQVPGNWTQIDEHGYAEIHPYVGTWIVVDEYKVN